MLLTIDLVLFLLAVLPFLLFYGTAVHGSRVRVGRRWAHLPLALALGLGMAASQTRAVFGGLFGDVGTFVRTPKRGTAARTGYRARGSGRSTLDGLTAIEITLAAYMVLACGYAAGMGYVASLPFLALFAGGYSAVALGSLRRT